MSIRNLEFLFAPRSIAIVGASERPHSIGATVLRNVVESGFVGPVYPVNPKYRKLAGLDVYSRISRLPTVPDLALICTPPATIAGLINELGEYGTRAAIVLTTGLETMHDKHGRSLIEAMLVAAKPHLLRILGPDSLGLLVPGINLNASYAPSGILPGKLAFVSQSNALAAGVLDWARAHGIGFSRFISLGDSADIDVGDVLDYLAGDGQTQAVLMHIEEVQAARKFMSAARGAARGKPVLALKSGRIADHAHGQTRVHADVAMDAVYDAAIRRAGMLRVFSTVGLFDAAETLSRARSHAGDRLAILTNGAGPGAMAADALQEAKGHLALLSAETLRRIDDILPPSPPHTNPVDILDQAPPEHYAQVIELLLQDAGVDAVMVIHAPSSLVAAIEVASAVVPLTLRSSRNILTCWLGGQTAAASRSLFSEVGMPTYDTPEEAVRGFMQIAQFQRNQALLMEVPAAADESFVPNRAAAQALVAQALASCQYRLSDAQSATVLAAYGIPVATCRSAVDAAQAAQVAEEIGFPVALKMLSSDIPRKSDIGGIALDLRTPEAVREAALAMALRAEALQPAAGIAGFIVQEMVSRPLAYELFAGVANDPAFGPVILFGQDDASMDEAANRTVGLPPLNMVLAADMVSRTRVARLLGGYRNRPPANLDAICHCLLRLSALVTDIPQIARLDIAPLLADQHGVLARGARIRLAPAGGVGTDRMAIKPYPQELEQWIDWQGEALLLRPIRPEDGAAHLDFFHALDAEDVRLRLFTQVKELQPSQLARLTQIDYDREMAFIATRKKEDGTPETLGVARAIADPDNVRAEFAISVRSDLKGKKLGVILMNKLIDYYRAIGTREMVGEALRYNQSMLGLAAQCGFDILPSDEGDTMMMHLDLGLPGEAFP